MPAIRFSTSCATPCAPLARRALIERAEVLFPRAAHGAHPVVGDLLERRTRRDAPVRVALVGVVDESARLADPLLLGGDLAHGRDRLRTPPLVVWPACG